MPDSYGMVNDRLRPRGAQKEAAKRRNRGRIGWLPRSLKFSQNLPRIRLEFAQKTTEPANRVFKPVC